MKQFLVNLFTKIQIYLKMTLKSEDTVDITFDDVEIDGHKVRRCGINVNGRTVMEQAIPIPDGDEYNVEHLDNALAVQCVKEFINFWLDATFHVVKEQQSQIIKPPSIITDLNQ